MVKAHNKLLTASFRIYPMGTWAPVMITVFLRFSIMNDKALAVYDKVSVPCSMIKAS